MSKALVVVDMQNDFIDGSLGTKEAEGIVNEVVKTIEDPSYDRIFVTMDTHEKNYLHTFEGEHLPVEHCIKDTPGWELNKDVQEALKGKNYKVIEKPTFGSWTLVQEIGQMHPDEIALVGLCTDICVVSNALLLRSLLYQTKITVLANACAGVTVEKHKAAVEVMRSCQIEVK